MYNESLLNDFIEGNKIKDELFTQVIGFETRFWISSKGRILSYDHRKNTIAFLAPYIDNVGYKQATLRMKPNKRKARVHVLVAEHFCTGKTMERHFVNHKDGNKLNNEATNLEWVKPIENSQHAIKTGLFNTKGERHFNCKLTESDVLAIRGLRKAGLTHQEIASRYNICRRQAGDIINRKNWGWLKTETAST